MADRAKQEMEGFRNPVLVLGGGVNGLAMARTFGRRGIKVYLAVERNREPVIFSKYCKGGFVVPGVLSKREAVKRLLRRTSRSLGRRAVVYPTSDLNTLALSELRDELPDDYHFVVGDKESVGILVRKTRFYKALKSFRKGFPRTYFPRDEGDVERLCSRIAYPVFIRPSITQLFDRMLEDVLGGTSRKGFVAHSREELTGYYRLARSYGVEVMFQEVIPGPPSNSYQLEGYYDSNHRPTVLFARRRLRIWPPDFGNTTLCVSIPLKELVNERRMVDEFIRRIGYHGLMSAEFKRDPRDGLLKILEINARPWWHFWLSARCGADVVFSSYLDAIGEKADFSGEYEAGVKSIMLFEDFVAAARMFREGSLGLQTWISSLLGKRVFASFAGDDLFPPLIGSANRCLQLMRSISIGSIGIPR